MTNTDTAVTNNLVRISDVARRLGLSRKTIYAWTAQRRISYCRLGRSMRIPLAEVDRLLQQGTVSAAQPLIDTPAATETAGA